MKPSKFRFSSLIVFILALILPALSSISAELPQAKEDKGLIIFFRENAFKGGAIRFNLNHGQEPIGALASGTTLHRYVDPGQQTFWSQAISQDSVTVDVKAGETYYIRGVVQMGLVAGRPKLTIVSESEARPAIAKMQ